MLSKAVMAAFEGSSYSWHAATVSVLSLLPLRLGSVLSLPPMRLGSACGGLAQLQPAHSLSLAPFLALLLQVLTQTTSWSRPLSLRWGKLQ